MTTLPNTGVVLGVIGGDVGTWGTVVNNALANFDGHNHIIGAGAPIPVAALDIDADISFGGVWAPTHLHRVTFDAVTALAANNLSLFVNSADHELYFRSNSGTNIKFTSGTSLNVAAFTGGIGGDYTAVAAALNYVDATKTYTFKQGGGTTWAKVVSGGLRLIEFGSSETVFVEQLCPTALAGSYSVTWPTALPATSGLVQISSAGVLSTGPTLPTAKQLLAIDQTGALSTGTPTQFHAGLCIPQGGNGFTFDTSIVAGIPIWCMQVDSTHELMCPLVAPVGFTLTAWSVTYNKTSGSGTATFKLFDYTNDARSQIGSTQSLTAAGAASPGQSGLSTVITAGHYYAISIVGGGSGTDTVSGYSGTW